MSSPYRKPDHDDAFKVSDVPMALIVRGPDGDLTCPLEPHDTHLLKLSWAWAKRSEEVPRFLSELSCYFVEAMCRAVPLRYQRPAAEAVWQGQWIENLLGVDMPPEALMYNEVMAAFIHKHHEEFARRRLLELKPQNRKRERAGRKKEEKAGHHVPTLPVIALFRTAQPDRDPGDAPDAA